ncbi:hypothetical protein DYB37_000747 [Aphanomyces astaci]|uniref:HTH myb-type domain-containing protein n=1 Tax=Aphanomyces astaci TaxID=112090 RepID=A0A3R6XI35_APHAT|nr:hypothetical protein DYB37_000747 [Aphanomyces astaci]
MTITIVRFMWLLCASILPPFLFIEGQSTEIPKSCCATCLNTITAFHYDPTKWSECVKETACCFCSTPDPGAPTFDPVPPLVRNIPQVKQGEPLRFVWPGVVNVTYVFLQGNKTALPKLNDAFLKHDGDAFSACFDSVGTMYFRGWSKDPCMSASSEKVVRVVAGTSPDVSCSASTTPAPTKRGACNLQRAALRANGDCVCSWLEYSNPPDCTDPSIYKIGAITISATAGFIASGISDTSQPGSSGRKYERRTKRFIWPDELHRLFVAAVFDVGLKNASPKALLTLMGTPACTNGLTTEHLKSHLQKYRLNYDRSRVEFLKFFDESPQGAVTSMFPIMPKRKRSLGDVNEGSGGESSSDGEVHPDEKVAKVVAATSSISRQLDMQSKTLKVQAQFQEEIQQQLYEQAVLQRQLQVKCFPLMPAPNGAYMSPVLPPGDPSTSSSTGFLLDLPHPTSSAAQPALSSSVQLHAPHIQMQMTMHQQMRLHQHMLQRKVEVSQVSNMSNTQAALLESPPVPPTTKEPPTFRSQLNADWASADPKDDDVDHGGGVEPVSMTEGFAWDLDDDMNDDLFGFLK